MEPRQKKAEIFSMNECTQRTSICTVVLGNIGPINTLHDISTAAGQGVDVDLSATALICIAAGGATIKGKKVWRQTVVHTSYTCKANFEYKVIKHINCIMIVFVPV